MVSAEQSKVEPERVGILLVHGIGEQKRFEHLEEVSRNLIEALREQAEDFQKATKKDEIAIDSKKIKIWDRPILFFFHSLTSLLHWMRRLCPWCKVSNMPLCCTDLKKVTKVTVKKPCIDDVYDPAKPIPELTSDGAPVIISVETSGPKEQKTTTELHMHEVWWAHLDEPPTLLNRLSFWRWGLALWANPGYLTQKCQTNELESEQQNLCLPDLYEGHDISDPKTAIKPQHRLALFCIAVVIALARPVVFSISWCLKRFLGIKLPPNILVQYVGDVKLYQQKQRRGKGPLWGIKQRPRNGIKRRMVRAMIEMDLAGYDRWYILSHSLGSIIAFDSLNELDEMLPNYFDNLLENRWKQAYGRYNVITRKSLFKNLRGLLTYGSPLSKFAVLWPVIVSRNLNKDFNERFEWINIYDPSDPVSNKTKYFGVANTDSTVLESNSSECSENSYQSLLPKDQAYDAGWFHLISHVCYVTFKPNQKDRLVHAVIDWLLEKNSTFAPPEKEGRWLNETSYEFKLSRLFQRLTWALAGISLPTLLVLLYSFYKKNVLGLDVTLIHIVRDTVITLIVFSMLAFLVGTWEHWRRCIQNNTMDRQPIK